MRGEPSTRFLSTGSPLTHEVLRGLKEGAAALGMGQAEAIAALVGGDLLEGLELERSPAFAGWLAAQRRRLRGAHLALLERLTAQAPAEASLGHLERWLALAPLERRAHERYLGALARLGRIRDGEEHLALPARRTGRTGNGGEPPRRRPCGLPLDVARRSRTAPNPGA